MSFQPGANLYTQGFGSRPETIEVPHIDTRAPSSTDVRPVGKRWIYQNNGEYVNLNNSSGVSGTTSNWVLLGTTGGALNTLTGDSGGALSPTANNINILGTAGQVTTTGSGSTLTLSLPSAITTPGSLTTTTTLSVGTTATIGTGLTVTSGGLTVSAGGAAITGNSTVTGSLTASTTLTATLGAITATNGNLVLGTAGNKISIATGANASIGTSDAMTAGTITISTTAVTASSKIFLTVNTPGGTQGVLSAPTASIVAGTSFDINSSSNTDTSTVNWLIIN